jgi:hypothetical protein
VRVTAHRTAGDWAAESSDLLAVSSPAAERGRGVGDPLNPHALGSLDEALPPAKARELVNRLAIYQTPTHGSGRQIAAIALRALTGQGRERRMPDSETLRTETTAWEQRRHARHTRVEWQFTPQTARIKLKRLYPQIQE